MDDKNNSINRDHADERLDANGQGERKDVDTRRWKAQDNEGHIIGSHQASSNEQKVQEENREQDASE